MTIMLINATQPDEVRVAIVHNRTLFDLDTEHPEQKRKKSDIYKGTITSIEPSLGAVFVNYGSERHGFLPLKEISREYFLNNDQNHLELTQINIHNVLKIGQEVVVQVDKEERGNKGAALTTFISLAGAYLVLMPNNPEAGGISRRIDGEDRDQLRESIAQLEIPEDMGVIVRTAGVNKSKEELQWDLNILLRYWDAIKQAAVARPAPYLIHQEGDVIIRSIRDYLRQDVTEIIIDEPNAYEKAKQHISQVRPDFIDRLKLYADPTPLFSRFQVEQQIEAAYQHEVRLPSGGSLVIDQTEALVSIDINSARATKGRSIEETALNINLEAADEIARQLRLRDIGGLIVIDFIDMTPVRNQREVENRLREALSMDRARIQVGRISRFGLLEMSRQRLRSSLSKASLITCPRCTGKGLIRSVESAGLSLVHMIQEQAIHAAADTLFQVQVPLEVATYIMNEKRGLIEDIEKSNPVRVMIIPNPNLQTPNHQLRQISKEEASREGYSFEIPSYKMISPARFEVQTGRKAEANRNEMQAAVTQFLSNDNLPTNPHRANAFSRFVKQLFGLDENKTKLYVAPTPTRADEPQRTEAQKNTRSEQRPAERQNDRRDRNNHRERGPRSPRDNSEQRANRPPREDSEQRANRPPREDNEQRANRQPRENNEQQANRAPREEGEQPQGERRSRNRNRSRRGRGGRRQGEGTQQSVEPNSEAVRTHETSASQHPVETSATHVATPVTQHTDAPKAHEGIVHQEPVKKTPEPVIHVHPIAEAAPAAQTHSHPEPVISVPIVETPKAAPRKPQRVEAPAQDTAFIDIEGNK